MFPETQGSLRLRRWRDFFGGRRRLASLLLGRLSAWRTCRHACGTTRPTIPNASAAGVTARPTSAAAVARAARMPTGTATTTGPLPHVTSPPATVARGSPAAARVIPAATRGSPAAAPAEKSAAATAPTAPPSEPTAGLRRCRAQKHGHRTGQSTQRKLSHGSSLFSLPNPLAAFLGDARSDRFSSSLGADPPFSGGRPNTRQFWQTRQEPAS